MPLRPSGVPRHNRNPAIPVVFSPSTRTLIEQLENAAQPMLCGLFRKNSRLPNAASAYWSIATWMASMCARHHPSRVESRRVSSSDFKNSGGSRMSLKYLGRARLPFSSPQNPRLARFGLLIALRTEVVHFRLHPRQESFCRGRRDPCSLKLQDLLALPTNLRAHTLDLRADKFECGHCPNLGYGPIERNKNSESSGPLD
jgi:hypothetical protein